MKRWMIPLLALILLVATVIPAQAAPEAAGTGPRGTFSLVGNITAIRGDTITVQILRGNVLVKPFLGRQLTVMVTKSTRYLYRDGTTTTIITFTDLKVGDAVSMNGTVTNNIWTTSRITKGASLSCLP